MQTDKERIEDVNQGVIDLPVAQEFHAAFLHVFQGAAEGKCLETSAVAVGRAGDIGFVGQQDPAVQTEIRQCALLEDKDVVGVQAVIVVRVKDLDGLVVVQRAGHDVPGARGLVSLRDRRDGIGEDLKQRLVPDGADGEIALRAVEAEPCPLAAGDHKGGDLSGRYRLPACFDGLAIASLLLGAGRNNAVKWRWKKVNAHRSRIGSRGEILHPLVYFGKVQPLDLCQQSLSLALIQLLQKPQKMALPMLFQQFSRFFKILLNVHIFKSGLERGILGKLE